MASAAAAATVGTAHGSSLASRGACCEADVTVARRQVVLFGDSITQQSFAVGGWGQRLANLYERRMDVLNRGFSGYNTRWASFVLERLLPGGAVGGPGVALWTLFLGANDSALPDGTSARQHVPLDEYEENLKAMIRRIQLHSPDGVKIVVMTPPPIDEETLQAYFPGSRTDNVAGQYAAAACRAAAASGVEALDLYSAMHSQEEPPSHFLSDGLHLNDAGNELVFRLLSKLLEDEIPFLAVKVDPVTGDKTSPLPLEFPHHANVDHVNPGTSFVGL